MKQETQTVCLDCHEIMISEIIEKLLHRNGHTIKYSQPTHRCPQCGEVDLTPEDMKATEAIRANFIRESENLLPAEKVRTIRKRFFHSQKEAGRIWGGGPVAFSRYETGVLNQSRSTKLLLRLLNQGKIKIEDLTDKPSAMFTS